HLEMKWAQAEAMREGYLPLLDVYRAGGQPLLGNLNAVPLYPDNLLYLAAPFFWAFNAHFWLHVLLAPFAMAWLGRAWGLSPPAAWAAGVCYGLSGFYLSNLTFYNLIAGATLAPALVAAALRLTEAERRRGWRAAAVAGLWALLLLAGDPVTALLAAVLAWSAVAVRGGRRLAPFGPLAFAFACGTLLAAPQLVEFLRILPLSQRGQGYGREATTVASWDPQQLLEWLVPFFFGRPDRMGPGGFWGRRYYTNWQPYYYALYPGLFALLLAASAGLPRRRRAAWWAWGAAGLGIFLALGRFNPLAAWLFALPRAEAFRYPVKFWLLVAVGAAVLCGIGFERVFEAGRRAAFRAALAVLVALLAGGWALLSFLPGPAEALSDLLIPQRLGAPFAASERTRWAGLCLLSLLVLAAVDLACGLLRRRPLAAGTAALLLHAGAQLFFLAPLAARDAVLPYTLPPPLLAAVPPGSYAEHASFLELFGGWKDRARFPEPLNRWVERRAFHDLYPLAGPLWGVRYQLNTSPEGLDAFMTRMARGAIKQSPDLARVRMLAAWGLDFVLMNRELAKEALPHVRLVRRAPTFGQEVFVYELIHRAPRVVFAGEVRPAPTMTHAFRMLASGDFDPRRMAVVRQGVAARRGAGGTARLVREEREALEVEVDARSPGVLVVQRAHLPIYRATIDGRPAEPTVANLYRLGVEVPPGRHRVRLWVDRRPPLYALSGTALALLALGAFAALDRRRGLGAHIAEASEQPLELRNGEPRLLEDV
ncbi:MAG TPA: hypothetical protein VF121_05795, partial [Thermoanaerobaculia bacterium]|nr:hypothetical protein [Thermoanaerobaculia bacterium]